MKAPIQGATVDFYALLSDGTKGELLGSAMTDSNGRFSATLSPKPAGPFLAVSSGGGYADEATGAPITLSSSDQISALVPAGDTLITLTFLTDMAAKRALVLARSGTPLATALAIAYAGVAQQYNLPDILKVLPVSADDSLAVLTALFDARIYGVVLAGLAQEADSLRVSAFDLGAALAGDMSDGTLDGMNASSPISIPTLAGGSRALSPSAGTLGWQSGINAFLSSPRNKTGLASVRISTTPRTVGGGTIGAGGLYITTTTLPAWIAGHSGSVSLAASGGTPPYHCSLQQGSVLPSGFSLSGDCVISGTAPALASGVSNVIYPAFTVILGDAASPENSATLELRITVVEVSPVISTASGQCVQGRYCALLVANATGGSPPYYYEPDSYANGIVPWGMSLHLDGTVMGTPNTMGTYTFGVCVIDLGGFSSCGTATITVVPPGIEHLLSVVKSGTGSGSVVSSFGGIDCGSACSANYANDTSVTLTAIPAMGSTFSGWSGACSGTGKCVVVMSADRTATAAFDSTPPATPLTGTWTGTWAWSGPGSNGCQFNDGGAFSMTLTQSGTSFSGSTSGAGIETRDQANGCSLYSVDPGTGSASGALTGTSVNNLSFNLGALSFTGTATLSGNSLSATFSRVGYGGSGTFTVSKQ